MLVQRASTWTLVHIGLTGWSSSDATFAFLQILSWSVFAAAIRSSTVYRTDLKTNSVDQDKGAFQRVELINNSGAHQCDIGEIIMFIFGLFTKQPAPNTSTALSERQYRLTLLPRADDNQDTSCDLPVQAAATKKLKQQQQQKTANKSLSFKGRVRCPVRAEARRPPDAWHSPRAARTFPSH